jgi:hypothetical protein
VLLSNPMSKKVSNFLFKAANPATMSSTTKTKPSLVAVKEHESSSDEEEFNGFSKSQSAEAEYERDSEEDELERLVFGDSAGFRQGIKGFKTSEELTKGKELVLINTDAETGTGLEAVDDADVCLCTCGSRND